MQYNDIWLILSEMNAGSATGWWVTAWYRFIVYLASAYTIVVLFLAILRNIRGGSLQAKDQLVINTVSWIVSLSLLLVIPSLLVKIWPGFALRLAGLEGVPSLQALSYANNQRLASVLNILCLQGSLGIAFVLVASLQAKARHILLKGGEKQVDTGFPAHASTQPIHNALPAVQVLDELTPVPVSGDEFVAEPEPAPMAAMPTPNKMTIDEVTIIPSPPLPLAAWLRSVSYKGGNNQIFELSVEQTEIGRQVGHITLNADYSISSNHATIYYSNSSFFIEDISRFQSTWVNEIQVEKDTRTPLRDGDTVRFGESKFLFNVLVWPKIAFLDGESQGKVISGQPVPILIGSGPNNHITINEPTVADVHARIELDALNKKFVLRPEDNTAPNSVEVFEENEEGGTQLSDPPWTLPDSALVKIGTHTFRIQYGKE